MEYGLLLLPAGVALGIALVLGRAFAFRSRRYTVEPDPGHIIDLARAAKRLSGTVRLPTITNSESQETDCAPFEQLIRYLEKSYPEAHKVLKREIVNSFSLLYRWPGRDQRLKPVLISTHSDVVPVENGTVDYWSYPPFSGAVEEGFVWGRGTLDDKSQIIAVLEAVENLLEQSFTPSRDFYLACGHDEETGGRDGAAQLANLLASRGVSFEYVLDEGGCVVEGVFPGVSRPVAVVGIGEKGFANIRLTAESSGGHSSIPPLHTAAGEIGRAVANLEKRQRPARISAYLKEMLSYIGPEMSFGRRVILANLWLFAPLFKRVFSSFPAGSALMRTTTAVTILEAGSRPNVLPQQAVAVVNFRLAPGESGRELLEHIRMVVGERIKVEPLLLNEPSVISPIRTPGYKAVEQAIYAIFPTAVAAPYIVMAGTDAVKYEPLSPHIYRFSPFQVEAKDLDRIHGTNERISLENIERGIRFYIELFKR